jgi:hypothetical protein
MEADPVCRRQSPTRRYVIQATIHYHPTITKAFPVHPDEKIGSFNHGQICLRLGEERSPVLSIGAGGTILQQIEEDTNDPRIWDTANAKLLSIHLLNSVEFERVTGLPPPETAVTAKVYAQQSLPFYDLYTEKASSVAAQSGFSKVKTLSQADARRECRPSFYYDTQSPPACNVCRKRLADCLYAYSPHLGENDHQANTIPDSAPAITAPV